MTSLVSTSTVIGVNENKTTALDGKSHSGYDPFRLLRSLLSSFIQSMAIGAGVGRTTIGALANSPHCVRSPQLRMRTSYA